MTLYADDPLNDRTNVEDPDIEFLKRLYCSKQSSQGFYHRFDTQKEIEYIENIIKRLRKEND